MRRAVLLLLVLTGCNAPGPGFRGIAPTRISIGQSQFDVRINGTRAQAIRLNPEYAPKLAAVAPRGLAAIERVSGCEVLRLSGDAAVMTALLDCGGQLDPVPWVRAYDCEIEGGYHGYADLVCVPVH